MTMHMTRLATAMMVAVATLPLAACSQGVPSCGKVTVGTTIRQAPRIGQFRDVLFQPETGAMPTNLYSEKLNRNLGYPRQQGSVTMDLPAGGYKITGLTKVGNPCLTAFSVDSA